MRIRLLTSLVALAAAVFVAGAASSATFTLAGKLTTKKGKTTNIPNVGITPCAPLTIMGFPGAMGTMTPAATTTLGPNERGGADLGCVPHAPGAEIVAGAGAAAAGGSFTLPPTALSRPTLGYAQVLGITTIPGVVQIATSNRVVFPPATIIQTPGGTQLSSCTGTGVTLMCANQAQKGLFRTGAWSTQTGRAGPAFTWCPPNPPPSTGGGPCGLIGQGGFNAIVKYNGTANGFGGTANWLTQAGPNPGSLAQAIGGGAIAIVPLGAGGSGQTGRGYADYGTNFLATAPIHLTYGVTTSYQGPVLGSQRVISMVGAVVGMLPPGTAFAWGFPFTTRTVLVRNTGARTTTFSAMGSDVVTSMGQRNISLVAGSVGLGRLTGIGDTPSNGFSRLWLPEPGASTQLIAGVIALLGIASWRSRRNR